MALRSKSWRIRSAASCLDRPVSFSRRSCGKLCLLGDAGACAPEPMVLSMVSRPDWVLTSRKLKRTHDANSMMSDGAIHLTETRETCPSLLPGLKGRLCPRRPSTFLDPRCPARARTVKRQIGHFPHFQHSSQRTLDFSSVDKGKAAPHHGTPPISEGDVRPKPTRDCRSSALPSPCPGVSLSRRRESPPCACDAPA